VEMKARGDEAVMLAAKTSRHNGKLAAMADLGKGNKLDMTMACNAAATKTKIIRHAAAVKKGKAPTAYDENQKDPAPHLKEGSCRSCRDQSYDFESKKRLDPSPSPPSSPHGGGGSGGGPAQSHSSWKDLP
jgi:hypothetical protein